MADRNADDPRDRIVAIEDELGEIEQAVEQSRKLGIVGRVGAATGCLLFVLGMWGANGALLLAGIAAALGGVVLAGSSRTTREDLLAQMAALEAERAEIIDARLTLADPAARAARPYGFSHCRVHSGAKTG